MRQHLPLEGREAEAGRLERVEGGQEGSSVHTDWHSVLRFARSVAGSTIRQQI